MDEKTTVTVKADDQSYINPGGQNLIRLYANSFRVGPTAGDMYMIGVLNNSPSFVVNMSFETAKTLKETLDNLIETFEKSTNKKIMTLNEVHDKLAKNTPK